MSPEGNEIRKTAGFLFIIVLLMPFMVQTGSNISTYDDNQPLKFTLAQYTPHAPITIGADSDFDDAGFSGLGTEEEPYLLENVEINTTVTAVSIMDSRAHFIFRNCLFLSLENGILLFNVTNGVFEDCIIQANTAGISATGCEWITIDRCEIILASRGIQGISFHRSTVRDCNIHHNSYGIDLTSGNHTRIEDSTFYSNTYTGVQLFQGTVNVTVFSNNFCWNGDRAFGEVYSVRNALDRGENNTWTANRWSDYEGGGGYDVAGGAGSVDPFGSLISDIDDPYIDGPDDIRYDEGDTGNWLNWNATDVYPTEMILFVNSVQIETRNWLTETFWFQADGFPLGSHNITVQYFDAAGNSASDEVWISVMISVFGGEGTEYVLYASMASIVCVAVLLLAIKRMR
ncbi:MAG: right-handed parallel beta-helix repeat-containing protein [Candidatus Thorarchaeota archaeon]|jgi:parallel beta-helix repeat protein